MKYEIRRSRRNGEYRAFIKGNNGEKVFMSELYTRVEKAKKAIYLIAPMAYIELYNESGQYVRTIGK